MEQVVECYRSLINKEKYFSFYSPCAFSADVYMYMYAHHHDDNTRKEVMASLIESKITLCVENASKIFGPVFQLFSGVSLLHES